MTRPVVVGKVDPDVLDETAQRAEEALSRPINIQSVVVIQWENPSPGNGFLVTVQRSALGPPREVDQRRSWSTKWAQGRETIAQFRGDTYMS